VVFDTENVHPGDKNTANDWIEGFFGAPATETKTTSDGRKYTRANFVSVSCLRTNVNETKKVATSNVVLVNNEEYINGKFNVNSLGSGENRAIFLSYIPTSGKPSRFNV
jgi:hypothetical protein